MSAALAWSGLSQPKRLSGASKSDSGQRKGVPISVTPSRTSAYRNGSSISLERNSQLSPRSQQSRRNNLWTARNRSGSSLTTSMHDVIPPSF